VMRYPLFKFGLAPSWFSTGTIKPKEGKRASEKGNYERKIGL
jgi:hypothetical protein